MIRIMLVDDHPALRLGLRIALEGTGIEVSAEADSGMDLLQKLKAGNEYDIILLDIDLPRTDGISILKEVLSQFPTQRVVMFSHHKDKAYVELALENHAKGFFSKEDTVETIAVLLKNIMQGSTVLSPVIQSSVIRQGQILSPKELLTDREIEVLRMLANGFKHKEIAEQLNIALRTVDFHRQNIKEKLDAESLADLVRIADKYRL
ncbi:hypothetical protein CH373_15755 [Leptospira perolatii]|uniref:DNA-binding response regulator n=1 Tax=Leptospira perolatii TaxID=2023191 RepID=A0A2M9ZJG0_9LEPT|nr:response regulator transcription factor [Leptospira perolatii]PJZ68865.1 hypothetical protein CH360_14215 [Leptospira perolatii]PJZ72196.1 hypothetical protein CH373_15755 [Leptospira perolatii]